MSMGGMSCPADRVVCYHQSALDHAGINTSSRPACSSCAEDVFACEGVHSAPAKAFTQPLRCIPCAKGATWGANAMAQWRLCVY